jgi:hypothetical protein
LATGARNIPYAEEVKVKFNPSKVGYGRVKYNAGQIAVETRATIPGYIPNPMPDQYASMEYFDDLSHAIGVEKESGQYGEQGQLIAGITDPVTKLANTMSQILAAIRQQQPTMQVMCVGGDTTLTPNVQTQVKFVIGNRPVPALKLIIQNPIGSLGTLWVGLSQPCGIGAGLSIPPGNVFDSIVNLDYIALISTAALPLVGVNGQGNAAALGIQIFAYSNPEWARVWGQI